MQTPQENFKKCPPLNPEKNVKDPSGKILGNIFDPTPPYLVGKEMQELIAWYQWAVEAKIKPPLILTANFIFEVLAIHPFQDGNGRTSRLRTKWNNSLRRVQSPHRNLVSF